MFLAQKIRIYPSATQRVALAKNFGCARFVYNQGLSEKKKVYEETGETLSRSEMSAKLPQMKEELPWLAEANSQSLQVTLANLDTAFKRFYKGISDFPKFKNKHSRQSFSFPQGGRIGHNFVKIPKIGKIKARGIREMSGKIKTCTISKTSSGKYYAAYLYEIEAVAPQPPDIAESNSLGIDLGLKEFAVLSDGQRIANPRHLKKREKRLRRAHRRLSRATKGSNRRIKRKLLLARQHEKVANTRKDFLHKLSSRLLRENQAEVFFIEDLGVKDMMKERWAKSIADVGWRTFRALLTYKAERLGKLVIAIDRYAPSSKLCSCGSKNDNLKLSDRYWTCRECGKTHERDGHAANNIKNFGLANASQENTRGYREIYARGDRSSGGEASVACRGNANVEFEISN